MPVILISLTNNVNVKYQISNFNYNAVCSAAAIITEINDWEKKVMKK